MTAPALRRLPVMFLLLLLLGLAACGGGSDGLMSGADGEASGGSAVEAPQEDSADFAEAEPVGRSLVQTRAVIRTGTVDLVSNDVGGARREVDQLLARHGGFVSQEQTTNDDRGRVFSSRLVLRIPSDAFDDAMNDLAGIGKLRDATRDAKDVTTQVIDIDTRVSTQEASLARLERFLGQAQTIEDVIRLESEIARRQADLESLKAQQKYLADQTTLATITVFLERARDLIDDSDRFDEAGFLAGLRSGWNALKIVFIGAATVAGALLPFAVALAILAIPVWLLVRTMVHRRTTAPSAPAAGPASDVPTDLTDPD